MPRLHRLLTTAAAGLMVATAAHAETITVGLSADVTTFDPATIS